ncbi:hypothetical protein NDU88_007649 [Pleurodeles waltl]|uniref:Uncharacterized protein n=1 Tax=Pleurodeles waltl TaxID=8319 RepID=A0AAV7PM13_PLEWA|nr:hypothetical protein NDU88_007649 [Pleurodeles waltl]
MPLWGRKKSEAESGRQHGAEARSIPGWIATDPFSGVAGLLNRWAALVLWEALDEKVTPLLVEDAVESVKLRGANLELKAAGQVGWLFLSALRTVYGKTLTQDVEIRKLRDEVAALQERQLLMKETIESAVTRVDQMEARCTALALQVAKQKSRQKPKMPSTVQVRALICKQKSRQKPKTPSTVQVRALVRKEHWDPYTWDGTVSDNDDWNWEDEVEVRVTELGGVESGEGRVGEIEGEKGVNGGQIQNSRLVRDYMQSELLERTRMFRQMPAEPLFKWLVRSWDTGAKDALQNPFTLGPITEGDPFELDMIAQDDIDDVVMWSLLRITDDRPVTLKTWVPLLGWTREGGVGNKVGRAREFAIVKWKWYLQQRAKPGPAGVSKLEEVLQIRSLDRICLFIRLSHFLGSMGFTHALLVHGESLEDAGGVFILKDRKYSFELVLARSAWEQDSSVIAV